MAEETESLRPLDSPEIKDGIANDVALDVRNALDKTCWLYGQAHAKFRAKWSLEITTCSTPGANVYPEDEHTVVIMGTGLTKELQDDGNAILTTDPIKNPQVTVVEGSVPYTPPNVFRKRHGMPIPTIVKRDDGSTEQKAVVFKRSTGRARDRRDDD